MVAIEQGAYTDALRGFGLRHSGMRAIVVISAHWQAPRPLRVTAWRSAPVIHDFGGFPDALYALDYPAPGAPSLAAEIAALAGGEAVLDRARGLDHGAWVPLRLAWPEGAVPALEVALPAPAAPRELFELGRALRPLRERGVLFMGSGGIVHNLRRVRFLDRDGPVDGWAAEFDRWVAERLAAGDTEALLSYRQLAPHAELAVPTTEHFDPLFCVLGACFEGEPAAAIYEGFQYGNLSMRSFRFASPETPAGADARGAQGRSSRP